MQIQLFTDSDPRKRRFEIERKDQEKCGITQFGDALRQAKIRMSSQNLGESPLGVKSVRDFKEIEGTEEVVFGDLSSPKCT